MSKKQDGGEVVARWGWGAAGLRCEYGRFAGLALAGVFLAAGWGHAQSPPQDMRLTVRPQTMATGTRNPDRSGYYLIAPDRKALSLSEQCGESWRCPLRDSLKRIARGGAFTAYIPPACVGGRRCPLLFFSNTYGVRGGIADKYGVIIVPIHAPYSDHIEEARAGNDDLRDRVKTEVEAIDRTITAMLQALAVDPAKVAILGGGATGMATIELGGQNMDVFSRVLASTQHSLPDLPLRTTQTTEYYISGGLLEDVERVEDVEHYLRDRGYPVKYVLRLGGHRLGHEDLNVMGQWLQESWAIPDPAARPAPYTVEKMPLLTETIMRQIGLFWRQFTKLPDSIRTVARQAMIREVVVPVGTRRVSTLMVDMAALAAQYPMVAAALEKYKLTPQQHDAYRAALFGARVAGLARRWVPFDMRSSYIPPMSRAARNLEVIRTSYRPMVFALEALGLWSTP